MDDSRIKSVSSLLTAFFDEGKLGEGRRYTTLFGSWARLAGQRLAAHSRILELEKGMLIVEAEHPGWIQLLQLQQSSILEAARRNFPELELRGILFRLERDPAAPQTTAADAGAAERGRHAAGGDDDLHERTTAPQEGPSDLDPHTVAAAEITDEDLRASLLRLKELVERQGKGGTRAPGAGTRGQGS